MGRTRATGVGGSAVVPMAIRLLAPTAQIVLTSYGSHFRKEMELVLVLAVF
jgi:hypothetical protein